MVHQRPAASGLGRSRWWLDGLRQVIPWLKGRSLTCVWQTLKRAGLVYKRGRTYVHSPDPHYDLKLAYITAAQRQVIAAPQQVVFLYQDELTYYARPSLHRDYAVSGHDQLRVDVGHTMNRVRRIAAVVDLVSARVIAWQRAHFKVATLLAFFRHIEQVYAHATRIFIALDNWSVHFHPTLSLAFQHSRLTFLRLPTYAPWTNPIERLWLLLKQQVIHHHGSTHDWLALQGRVQVWLDQWAHGSSWLADYLDFNSVFNC